MNSSTAEVPMKSRHTDRVPGFPACHLFALVDTYADLQGALHALEPHVEPGAVRLLTGESGVRALDVSGASRGLTGRMSRVLQDFVYGRGSLHVHESHVRRGGHLLLIPAREWAQCQQLVNVLTDWGAHGLLWFARFSVVDVTPRYCAATGDALAVR
jgi:hypothetical protein